MVESFRTRPHSAKHFTAIVDSARTNNPFYRRWLTDRDSVPIIDRTTFLDNNDEILNGFPVPGRTSGSTGVPVSVSQSSAWVQRDGRDTPGMRQYQVIQDGVQEFTVKVAAHHNIDEPIRAAFREHLGYVPDRMQMVYLDSIPREPSGKYRTSICNV